MRPRISIRGSVHPSVRPYVRYHSWKTAEKRSKQPKNIAVVYWTARDASICPPGLVFIFFLQARETPEPELKSPDENIDDVIREVCGDDLRETDEPGMVKIPVCLTNKILCCHCSISCFRCGVFFTTNLFHLKSQTADGSYLSSGFPISDFSVRSLLHIEHKNLNPDNEMKKIFGSKVSFIISTWNLTKVAD